MKLHQRTVAVAAALGFLIAPVAFAQTPAPAAPAAQATQTPQAPPSAATLARTKELEAMAAGG